MPPIGPFDEIEIDVDVDDEGDGPRATRIKPGSPLSVRVVSVFPGDKSYDRGDMAMLTSAVRSPMLHDAQPLAMHYLYRKVSYGGLLPARADEPGSDVIYYSPAELSEQLDVVVRLTFDKFNMATFNSWIDAAATAVALPVFAVSGPAGSAWVAVGKNAAKLVTRVVDRALDGDNERVMTWRINLSSPGRPITKSGYVLLYPDGNKLRAAEVVAIDGDTDGDGVDELTGAFERDGKQFIVRKGKLHWRNQPDKVVVTGDAFVLAYVNGAKIRGLEGWSSAAVSASLAEKFLNAGTGGAEDALEAFKLFNDVHWLKEIASIDREAAALAKTAASGDKDKLLKELNSKRTAFHKNIQDETVRDLSERAAKETPE